MSHQRQDSLGRGTGLKSRPETHHRCWIPGSQYLQVSHGSHKLDKSWRWNLIVYSAIFCWISSTTETPTFTSCSTVKLITVHLQIPSIFWGHFSVFFSDFSEMHPRDKLKATASIHQFQVQQFDASHHPTSRSKAHHRAAPSGASRVKPFKSWPRWPWKLSLGIKYVLYSACMLVGR